MYVNQGVNSNSLLEPSNDSLSGSEEGGTSGRRSKICAICLTNSESFHLNYGAPTCLSCRAFFRRIVQSGKTDRLACKRSDTCNISYSNRTKCRKCRFKACIRAGMNMEAVMNELEKHDRFRNYDNMWKRAKGEGDPDEEEAGSPPVPQKIQFMAKPHGSAAGPPGGGMSMGRHGPVVMATKSVVTPMEVVPGHTLDLSRRAPRPFDGRGDLPLIVRRTALPPPVVPNLQPQLRQVPHLTRAPVAVRTRVVSNGTIVPLDPMVKVEPRDIEVVDQRVAPRLCSTGEHRQVLFLSLIWSESLSKMKINQRFLDSLIQFHKHSGVYTKPMLHEHLKTIGQHFLDFAVQIPEFKALTPNDQVKQLDRAVPMFISFIFAKYLGLPTGSEQFQWLFLLKSIPVDLQPTSFYEVNLALNLLQDTRKTVQCGNLVDIVAKIQVDLSKVFTVACACLFDPHPETQYDSLEQLVQSQETVLGYFALDRGHLWELIDAINRLSEIYTKMDWNNPMSISTLRMPFTDVEENWMDQGWSLINRCFQKVPLGEDHIKQVIASELFDVPFPPNFFRNYLGLWSKRFLAILQLFDEFQDLSNENQCRLWQSISNKLFSITMIKFESLPDAVSQLRFALGFEDMNTLEEMIRPWGTILEVMPRMGMKRSNRLNKFFDKAMEGRIEVMKREVAEVLQDVQIFSNCFMFLLFSQGKCMFPGYRIATLSDQYLRGMYRKLDAETVDPTIAIARLDKCLSNLDPYQELCDTLF